MIDCRYEVISIPLTASITHYLAHDMSYYGGHENDSS